MAKYYEAYEIRYRQVHEYSLSWASNHNSPIVLDTIQRYVKNNHAKILDIGCGEGRDCLFLLKLGYDVQALDISEEAIDFCKKKADEKDKDRFHVADVCTEDFGGKYDFIYSVATIHMLVLRQDRESYLSFIRKHLTNNGYALILSMGDGLIETESNIMEAFENKKRIHQETGKELSIASTSCKMVNFQTFREELRDGGFDIVEDGLTCIEPDFPTIMYAIVKLMV